MSLQFKKKSNTGRNLRVAAASSAVVVGVSYIVLNTFPHLKTSIYNYLTGTQDDDEEDLSVHKSETKEDNEPIELKAQDSQELFNSSATLQDESLVDVAEWSNANLKSWLGQKSVLQPMLLMITLFPLLSQYKKLVATYNMILNINLTQVFLSLFLYIRQFLIKK
ncbi:uncharacterized protein RJT20DRAFT_49586 [Scheffersomyces xylosifermentans]|uniref:uncharacterized protein n=1 Tax=Scheffersomyces xylosifermentans TaxID=1304137 RepID=UPI00315D07B8